MLDQSEKIDIIHFQHLVPSNFIAIHCKYVLRIPSICTYHWTEDHELWDCFPKIFSIDWFEKIICVSQHLKWLLPKLHHKTYVIPPWVPNYFKNKKNHSLESKLIFVGRLIKEKWIIEIIDVFKKIIQVEWLENYILEIIWDWPLKKTIENDNKELIIQKRIILLWSISHKQVAENLGRAKIFLFWSIRQEPFWMVLTESMALWIPIVATDVWAVKTILPLGYKYITNNRDTYFNSCIEILNNNRLSNKISIELIDHSQSFYRKNIVNSICNLYYDVSKSSK